jgi:hypothetical protein
MSEAPLLRNAQLARHIRARLLSHLYDDSGVTPGGIAIYSLSDPRDIRNIRYVGQTAAPRRRLLQHLSTARLWLPDELPWWVSSPRLRPLYRWIRQLYQEEGRLPIMLVTRWVEPAAARLAEQALIRECLEKQLALMNVEMELLHRQLLLPLISPTDARHAVPARSRPP